MTSTKGICVVGRLDFHTGYGRHTLAALELLSRTYLVKFRHSRDESEVLNPVQLPSGRTIERALPKEEFTGYFYADIPWNGFDDPRIINLPTDSFRVAHLAWDSTVLPAQWVKILNSNFDLALFTSEYLLEVANSSGIAIPLGVLPLGLDLADLLSYSPDSSPRNQTIFGSLSAYHPRKNLDKIVEAFVSEFDANENVSLRLHSNLSMNREHEKIERLVRRHQRHDILLSHSSMTEDEKNTFIEDVDVYINASSGEGFSIGPRESLAARKLTIVSDIPGQKDLVGIPNVFAIPAEVLIPAVYPEMSNQVIGNQLQVDTDRIRESLREAHNHNLSGSVDREFGRKLISELNYEQIKQKYIDVFSKENPFLRKDFTEVESLYPDFFTNLDNNVANFGRKKLVVPLHDAGYFSIFNVFLANLVWSEFDERHDLVIPDWRAEKLIQSLNGEKPTSFCYSKPEDGNLWNLIYLPLPGVTNSEMNDDDFLTSNFDFPETKFVEDREPLLTYTNAYELYKAPWFSDFRKLYNRVLRENVVLRPEFQKELDIHLSRRNTDKFRIAAHVRHPSHAIEQPGGKMAGVAEYCEMISKVLGAEGLTLESDDWEFFVASDNAKSINAFVEIFGEKVNFVKDVDRVEESQIDAFELLDESKQLVEGHQIQHLKAADTSSWTHRNVFEVWRDAELLAASDVLLHSVSNVATAVSFMNPEIKMVFCDPKLS